MSALATRTHTYRSTFGVRKQKKIVFLETSQAVAPIPRTQDKLRPQLSRSPCFFYYYLE